MPEYEAYITHGREERNLEYKRSMNWNNAETKGKITKSILAMSNIRDGGVIVIGVEQRGQDFVPVGMNSDDLESFKQDDIASYVANYAAPFVEFSLTRYPIDQNEFIVIEVKEFSEIPIVCRQDGPERLRRGAIYTRTRRINETAEVSSEAEMREILDMATEKRVRSFLAMAQRAGLQATPIQGIEDIHRQRSEDQLQGL